MAARKRRNQTPARRRSLKVSLLLAIVLAFWGTVAEWFVHHPRKWLAQQCDEWPRLVTDTLFLLGNPLADLTDACGLTGHDAIYEYDTSAPKGNILFAGIPVRTGYPAPNDLRVLNRGHFLVGWSDSLRHPVWCAYHVVREAPYEVGKRPGFTKDGSLARTPSPNDYARSGYDRGHMVPNYAIATRYGHTERKKTFMMSNIAPQAPALNRGVWRDLEHRIADFWTKRYGEIWVIVGCISNGNELLSRTDIDIPTQYYQVIIAQEGLDVRALAMIFPQTVGWRDWAARHIISIDELEELTGLDFNPELPSFIQDPLEADLPSRLWPIRPLDLFRLVALRYM